MWRLIFVLWLKVFKSTNCRTDDLDIVSNPRLRRSFGQSIVKSLLGLITIASIFGSSPLSAASVINAISCSQADVQDAVNRASTGDVVTIPSGTCTWKAQLIISVGITLAGQGIGNTIIKDALPTNNNVTSLSPLITWTCVTNASHRMTGIEFRDGGRTPLETNGIIRFRCVNLGPTSVRVDHNKFDHLNGDMLTFNSAVGVTDHNIFLAKQNEIPVIIRDENWNAAIGQDGTGDFSWSGTNPVYWGSSQFMFIEDNTITFDQGARYICNDGFSGARAVFRFNNTSGCTFEVHGTESSNRQRGTRAVEIYKNSLNGVNQTNILADIRSGSALVWGNTGTNLQTPARAARLDDFRTINNFAPFSGANGKNNWDVNDPKNPYGTFTVSSIPGALQVKVATATWAVNQWVGYTIRKTSACSVTNCFGLIVSNTATTLNYLSTSVQGFAPDLVMAAGDKFEINRVLNVMDQPGRGGGGLVSGVTPKLPLGWNNQYNDPIYQWLNTGNGVSIPLGFDTSCSTCRPNEHYYDYSANFNGSSGMGAGPAANRPHTCVVGVWYWAADEGEWWSANAGPDGHAYKCTAPNVWTVGYTPYTYPHPLVSGSSGSSGTTDTTPPSVAILAPTTGSSVLGTAVVVSATAFDNVAVANVQFQLDGLSLGAALASAPYSITWDTTTVANGSHVLSAMARDSSNNQTTSAPVNVSIANPAPAVSITGLVNGAIVSGTSIAVSATAASIQGVAGVQFQLDGVNVGPAATLSPYAMTWDTTASGNGSHSLTAVATDGFGNQGISSPVTVTVDNPSYLSYSIPDLGGQSWNLSNTGSLAIQYARIVPDAAVAPPSGFAIYGFTNGGGLLTGETAVPVTPALTTGRIFLEAGNGIRTGISLANPNSQDTVVTFYFTDANGNTAGSGSLTIPANRQVTGFLDQSPFFGPASIFGTFTFTASPSAVSAIGFRNFTNASGPIMTTLPVVPLVQSFGSQQVLFPRVGLGDGWASEVVLVNPTNSPQTGTLQFFGQPTPNGITSPFNVMIGGTAATTYPYTVPPQGQFHLMTNGAGWVMINPDTNSSAPEAFSLLSYKNLQGVMASQTAILSPAVSSAQRAYMEASGTVGQNGAIRTNLSLLNPSSSAASVQLDLYNTDGTPTGLSTALNLPPNGMITQTADQLWPQITLPFSGIVRLTTASSVMVVAVRERFNARGDLLMATTPLSDELNAPTGTETNIAYVPSGGGYASQIVLFPTNSTAAGTGTLWFVNSDGSVAAVSGVQNLLVLP